MSRILNKIIRQIGERERREKRIESAVTALNCQIDVERSVEEKKAAEKKKSGFGLGSLTKSVTGEKQSQQVAASGIMRTRIN